MNDGLTFLMLFLKLPELRTDLIYIFYFYTRLYEVI